MKYIIKIPVVIISEANNRDHWAKKYKRAERQKKATILCLMKAIGAKSRAVDVFINGKYRVKLFRILGKYSKLMDSHDNLRLGFKAMVDAIASYVGIDDGCGRIDWKYYQRKDKSAEKSYVIMEIGRMNDDEPQICD